MLSTYSDYNDFIVSETNGNVGAVIIFLLNAFEQSAILTVSYVCKASIVWLRGTLQLIMCFNQWVCRARSAAVHFEVIELHLFTKRTTEVCTTMQYCLTPWYFAADEVLWSMSLPRAVCRCSLWSHSTTPVYKESNRGVYHYAVLYYYVVLCMVSLISTVCCIFYDKITMWTAFLMLIATD